MGTCGSLLVINSGENVFKMLILVKSEIEAQMQEKHESESSMMATR